MKLFKMTIRSASGLEFTYNHVARISYASPRHIDFVSVDDIHTRVWSDNLTSLFYEIAMEEEDQVDESEEDLDRKLKLRKNSVYGSEVYDD